MKARTKTSETSSTTISFRLNDDVQIALAARADVLGVSVHELARHYVMEMLGQGEERSALREAVVAVHNEVHLLRENVMISIRALLSSAGRVKPDEAEKWTEKVFEIH